MNLRAQPRKKRVIIKVNILGDELFEHAFGVGNDVIAYSIKDHIYLRRNSVSIFSDTVHEGMHVMDYISGFLSKNDSLDTITKEIRAFAAEHHFQKASGLRIEFNNEDEIVVHVWNNYK